MSVHRLAETLDDFAEGGSAVVSESPAAVFVFGLSLENANKVIERARCAQFSYAVADEEGNNYCDDDLSASFAPYTVTIKKAVENNLQILTNSGFAQYLKEERTENVWNVGRLRTPITTLGRVFLPWGMDCILEPSPKMKNPRTLVKESSTSRIVASDIRPWILRSDPASLTCTSSLVWVNACIAVCLKCLPDEVDAAAEEMRFKGPPKRSVAFYVKTTDEDADFVGFDYLQSTVSWIYELENQAEIRSLYFKAEVVRSGLPVKADSVSFLQCLDSALEGAKIAYAMSVSELGKDTVKALSDLKKSITEDTAKLTEATRQTVGAVAAALAVGIGLLAARIGANAPINLIGSIMIVVALYVALIIWTGWSLVCLQGQLRRDWHPKIYRFLTDDEYKIMVENPALTAERSFCVGAGIGGLIVFILTFYIICIWYQG